MKNLRECERQIKQELRAGFELTAFYLDHGMAAMSCLDAKIALVASIVSLST